MSSKNFEQDLQHAVNLHVYCPSSPLPTLPPSLPPASAHPPLPPYIIHLSTEGLLPTSHNLTAFDLLERYTNLHPNYTRQLCDLGALYLRIGPPSPRISPRPIRITREDATAPLPHQTPLYLRVYATPKRHVMLTPLVLLDRSRDAIVVCKPAGLPVAPSVDNARECVMRIAEEQFGEDELFITTRLDVCTSGVLVLATKRNAVARLNKAMASALKTYLVWTYARPQFGVLKHWINAAASRRRGPLKHPLVRPFSSEPPPNVDGAKWVDAVLIVKDVQRDGHVWQSRVELVTGRTHQIRIQFAAQNWSLVGDVKYGAGRELAHVEDGVQEEPVQNLMNGMSGAGVVTLGEDPLCIGLHAFSLQVDLDGGEGGGVKEMSAPASIRGGYGLY